MSGWILSIAGVCFISVIADLILPEGKMNGQIKSVISLAIIMVVILPLPNLVNKDFFSEDIFNEINMNIQTDYLYSINQGKLDALKNDIESSLKENGILGVEVSISADIFTSPMEINAVYVDLYNAVISENAGNINIKTEVASVVLSYINIPKDKVVFYE